MTCGIKTRLLSFILTLLIIFQILPVTVFAEEMSGTTDEATVQDTDVSEYDTEDMNYDYDSVFNYSQDNRLSMQTDTLDYLAGTDVNRAFIDNHYSYTDDGKVSSSYVSFDGRTNITYSYDPLGRLYKKEYSYPTPSGFTGSEEYIYDIDANGLTAGLVGNYISKMGSTSTIYTYIYDGKGNITDVICGSDRIEYTYDDIGQLIRENNSLLGKTYVYEYDDAGNILSKKAYAYTNEFTITSSPTATYTYTYGNSEWGDQLTGYNGSTITYDAVGNPLSYYSGFSFGWRGRDLISATKGGLAYTFEYNADGLRTSKTVGGTVHKYYYSGALILAEEWGNNLMVFLYDANGAPIGMKYRTTSMDAGVWNTYWYERNLQGDVVAIYNESGVKVVSYVYDAWGSFTATYHNGGASLTPVIKNPLLYRGYYYDRDLGMYYLQTRYYDSNIGRFLNADSVISGVNGSLNGYNLYAYCFNNPVSLTDGTGNWPQWAIDVGNWLNNNVFQPIATFINDIVEDARNYNEHNTDEQAVINANVFSSYKDAFVLKTPGKDAFTFGILFIGNGKTDPTVVKHEYGHYLQMQDMGVVSYTTDVALPSVTFYWLQKIKGKEIEYDYYGSPWESDADVRGGVDRKYTPWSADAPSNFIELIPLFWK